MFATALLEELTKTKAKAGWLNAFYFGHTLGDGARRGCRPESFCRNWRGCWVG